MKCWISIAYARLEADRPAGRWCAVFRRKDACFAPLSPLRMNLENSYVSVTPSDRSHCLWSRSLAAQLASFYTKHILKWTGFIGFGGLEHVKFRMAVPPGVRMYILTKQTWHRHRRVCCNAQGMVNGDIVFEAGVIGTQM